MTTLDILASVVMLSFNILGLICSLIFITIAICHRQCHTTTILLVLNSVIAGLISNVICGSQAIYQLVGDGSDHLCVLRGYLLYSSTGLLYHTLCVQALHRFFVIVLGTRRYLQKKKVIGMIVLLQWAISSSFVLPIVLDGRIRYNPGSRICLISINDAFAFLYIGTCVYFFTMFVIVFIYVLILRHMKMNAFVTTDRQRRMERRRQRREGRLYFRIVVLIVILFVMGIPYCVFFAISMIQGAAPSPPYADRICYLSIAIGYGLSMLLSLLYTDDVRRVLNPFEKRQRRNTRRRRQIRCITALTVRPPRVTVEVTA